MTKFISMTIHDGNHETIVNSNWFTAEIDTRAALVFEELAKRGWEAVSVTPCYTPNILEEGRFSFFIGGYKALFKKEADDDFEEDFTFIKEISQM